MHKKHRKTRRFRLIYLDDFRSLITFRSSAQDREEEDLPNEGDPKKKREGSPLKRESPPPKSLSPSPSSKAPSEDVNKGGRACGRGGERERAKREEDPSKGKRRGGREERRMPSEKQSERYGKFKILPRENFSPTGGEGDGGEGDEPGEWDEHSSPRWEEGEFENEGFDFRLDDFDFGDLEGGDQSDVSESVEFNFDEDSVTCPLTMNVFFLFFLFFSFLLFSSLLFSFLFFCIVLVSLVFFLTIRILDL